MVVADPDGSARFRLNSLPLDRAQYAPGEQVTIDVLPEAGWEIGEWVGPVYDVTGNTAKVDLVVSQAVVVRLKNKESSTSTSTAGPTDTPLPEPTPTAALKPAATPTATPPLTAPPTPIRLESLVIEPSILVFRSKGETHAVTATGVYSDGSSQDITGASFGTVYNAGDSRIAEVSLDGIVTAHANGSTKITVSNQGVVVDVEALVIVPEATVSPPDLDKIVEDPETGEKIVANRVLILFSPDATDLSIERIIGLVAGRVVGLLAAIAMYQVEVPAETLDELERILEQLEAEDLVHAVEPETLVDTGEHPIDNMVKLSESER